MAFFSSVVDNTFEDPCGHVQRNPRIGPTVEALATALSEIPGMTATAPIDESVAAYEATYIQLTTPVPVPCTPNQFYLWQDSPNNTWWVVRTGEVIRAWILDVEGQRVVIAARSWPDTSEETKAQFETILDSIAFQIGA
jgi:hypothetical protein